MLDSWQPIFALVAAILIAYAVILWLGTIVWVYRDSRERTRDSWSHIVALSLVLFFLLPGLILYLVLRPRETLLEAYERRLETEALVGEMPERRACPSCQRPARPDYIVCPYCRTGLRQACPSCQKPLELTWAACPYCGGQGPQRLTAPAAPATAPPPAAPTASQPVASSRVTEPAPAPRGGTTS